MHVEALHYREAGRGWQVAPHAHHAWQWYLCLHGSLSVGVDAVNLLLGPYQSVFVPPDSQRMLDADRRRAPGYLVAIFDLPEVDLTGIGGRRIDTPPGLRDEVQAMIREIRHPGAADARVLAEALLLRLIVAHKRIALAGEAPSPALPAIGDQSRRELVQRAEAFMAEHLAEPLTRGAIAAAVHVSEAHLARIFRATIGATVLGRLTGLRVERAARLLRDSELPIGRIAGLAGFVSFAHFSRTFRRLAGVAPSEYRASGGAAGAGFMRKLV
jgi:AraC-like DNA-binding protein